MKLVKPLLRWSTAAIAAAMLVVAGGAVAITYAASGQPAHTEQNEQGEQNDKAEQTGQHEDPAGPDEGPGQTGENQGDHQDPGDGPDAQDSETD